MIPPGQRPRLDFPRFGLPAYTHRFPARPADRSLTFVLPAGKSITLDDLSSGLPRTTLNADFHCVTTWSRLGLTWGGVKFTDFFRQRVTPEAGEFGSLTGVVLRAQDGYRTTLLLEDLLTADVLIADELDGQPLDIAHGAPWRLVAPMHFGYKSVKHLSTIEFHTSMPRIKRGPMAFLDHPRARVALEERGRWFPGWLLRHLYRPMIAGTARNFRIALKKYERASSKP